MEKYNIEENNNTSGPKKIRLYKDIFWASPWEEWFICKNCNNIYPKKFMWKCDCWTSQLEAFYKNAELKETFDSLSVKDWYTELVAKILDEDIWFIWWWNTSIDDLNNDKLWIDDKNKQNLVDRIIEIFPDFNFDNFYYFAEIWLKKDFRWKDIAWKLYRENLEKIKSKWNEYILVRTTRKSDLPYKWFIKDWYIEVFEYKDIQDRVILVCKI